LDREDRRHEYELAVEKWQLGALLDRRLGTLSSTERTLANLARIELLKPAILVADRLLEHANPSAVARLADDIHRTLRVAGTTVHKGKLFPLRYDPARFRLLPRA